MVSNPNEVPPAFRRHDPSFTGLADEQVLMLAQAAFRVVQALPAASLARAAEWAKFDEAMGELARRATVSILAKIRERDGGPA